MQRDNVSTKSHPVSLENACVIVCRAFVTGIKDLLELEKAISQARKFLPADHRYIIAAEAARGHLLAGHEGPFSAPSSNSSSRPNSEMGPNNASTDHVVSAKAIHDAVWDNMEQKLRTTIRETRLPNQLAYLAGVVREAATLLPQSHPLFLRARLTADRVLSKHGGVVLQTSVSSGTNLPGQKQSSVANRAADAVEEAAARARVARAIRNRAEFAGGVDRAGRPVSSLRQHQPIAAPSQNRVQTRAKKATFAEQRQAQRMSFVKTPKAREAPHGNGVTRLSPYGRDRSSQAQGGMYADSSAERLHRAQTALTSAARTALSLHHFPVHGEFYSFNDVVDMRAFLHARARHIVDQRNGNQGRLPHRDVAKTGPLHERSRGEFLNRSSYSQSRAARVLHVLTEHMHDCEDLIRGFKDQYPGVGPDEKILKCVIYLSINEKQ